MMKGYLSLMVAGLCASTAVAVSMTSIEKELSILAKRSEHSLPVRRDFQQGEGKRERGGKWDPDFICEAFGNITDFINELDEKVLRLSEHECSDWEWRHHGDWHHGDWHHGDWHHGDWHHGECDRDDCDRGDRGDWDRGHGDGGRGDGGRGDGGRGDGGRGDGGRGDGGRSDGGRSDGGRGGGGRGDGGRGDGGRGDGGRGDGGRGDGDRYHGDRYHGDRYHGDRYHGEHDRDLHQWHEIREGLFELEVALDAFDLLIDTAPIFKCFECDEEEQIVKCHEKYVCALIELLKHLNHARECAYWRADKIISIAVQSLRDSDAAFTYELARHLQYREWLVYLMQKQGKSDGSTPGTLQAEFSKFPEVPYITGDNYDQYGQKGDEVWDGKCDNDEPGNECPRCCDSWGWRGKCPYKDDEREPHCHFDHGSGPGPSE